MALFRAVVSVKVVKDASTTPGNPWEGPSSDEVSGTFFSDGVSSGEALLAALAKGGEFAQGLLVSGVRSENPS